MTDYPRFEIVKGPPDDVYKAYHGARVVSLVFALVDRWRGSGAYGQRARGLDPASGAYEVHERPLAAPAESRAPSFARSAPEDAFARDYLMGTARAHRLQAGLLAVFIMLVVVLLVQTVRTPQPVFAPAAGHASPQTQRQLGMLRREPIHSAHPDRFTP